MSELVKRTHVYVLRPREYEISGCPVCGNQDTAWSEWLHHLWCASCEMDFLPEQNGVFDGPIPVNTSHLLGLCFAQVNLETREIEIFKYSKADKDCPWCKNAKVVS